MKRTTPPPLATWMLEHLTFADRDDALAGDLLEEFRCGRSALWYWWQVASAVVIGCRRTIHRRLFRRPHAGVVQVHRSGHELTLLAEPEQWSATRFFGFMLATGLLNAVIAAWIICRVPGTFSPSLLALLARAVAVVAITSLAGVGAARFYWNRAPGPPAGTPRVSFAVFALASAAGWVWIPSAMLLSTQNSPATATIVAVGAAILGSGLRNAIPASPDPPNEMGMFAATLARPRFESAGYVVSICFYLALWAFAARQNVNAGAPIAVCAFVLAWNLTRAPRGDENSHRQIRSAAMRLARTAVPAILLTIYALLFGIEHRNEAAARSAVFAAANASSASVNQASLKSQPGGNGLMGWQSVILWPAPPQREGIIAPPPAQLLAPGSNQPLIIHFAGPYWYFHAPHTGPGPRAHQARGDPLSQPIVASDSIPLVMEARQNLAAEIPLSRCREIDLALDYRNEGASISVALLLADSAGHGRGQVYLGQQQVVGEWAGAATANGSDAATAQKVLRFDLPARARIRGFDQILVMFLTDPQYSLVGPRIAIRDFRLLPR